MTMSMAVAITMAVAMVVYIAEYLYTGNSLVYTTMFLIHRECYSTPIYALALMGYIT